MTDFHLSKLTLNNVRNVNSQQLDFCRSFNFLYGPNGAGKTSVLEALYLMGFGRSFRHHQLSTLISHHQPSISINADVSRSGVLDIPVIDKISLQKSRHKKAVITVNGRGVRLSELVRSLPIVLFDAQLYELVIGSPSVRRRYLDWLLFHVEHGYFEIWSKFRLALKQRNALLKQINAQPTNQHLTTQLQLWTDQFIIYAEHIDQSRRDVLQEINQEFQTKATEFGFELDIALRYFKGWKKDLDLKSALEVSVQTEIKEKRGKVGPQFADMSINVEQAGKAADILSRGQTKIVASLLKLCHTSLYNKHFGCAPIILMDDLVAELDAASIRSLVAVIETYNAQVFITGTYLPEELKTYYNRENSKVFHVEHGQITTV